LRQQSPKSTVSANGFQTADELPDHVDARFCELEADIERLEAKRQAYDPDDIARGRAFVILNHDGMVRIERGFIRPGDEKPRPEAEQAGEASVDGDTEGGDSQGPQDEKGEGESATDEEDDDHPLSDSLVRDLTAHRTLRLRLDLSDQPEVALVAAAHALSAQIFYLGADAHVVGIQPIKTDLGSARGRDRGHCGREGVGGSARQLGTADAPRCRPPVGLRE
jgi:ParB family chromosome partitioning protein